MIPFNELVAETLVMYSDVVRACGHDMEYRGIQRGLREIAKAIKAEDGTALLELQEEYSESLEGAY